MNREFTIRNVARCVARDGFNHPLEDWSLNDWLVAMGGELGEAMNIAKKMKRIKDGIPGNKHADTMNNLRSKLAAELADVYIYMDLLCAREGIDLEEEVLLKFDEKSREIGYVEIWSNK